MATKVVGVKSVVEIKSQVSRSKVEEVQKISLMGDCAHWMDRREI